MLNSLNEINNSTNCNIESTEIKTEKLNSTEPSQTLDDLITQSKESKGIKSTDIEEKHVFEVYDEIALHWHHTRGKRKVNSSLFNNF